MAGGWQWTGICSFGRSFLFCVSVKWGGHFFENNWFLLRPRPARVPEKSKGESLLTPAGGSDLVSAVTARRLINGLCTGIAWNSHEKGAEVGLGNQARGKSDASNPVQVLRFPRDFSLVGPGDMAAGSLEVSAPAA